MANDTGQSALPSAATARAAFARLKTLAGDWEGTSTDATTGDVYFDRALFDYRLTGAGSALIEFANAGTPEEMLSIFFMDGDRLVLQHYCTVANQPRLELIRADSTGLLFDLAGGVNLDPGLDGHIHRVRFTFDRDGGFESLWTWFDAGREHHVNRRVIVQRREPRLSPGADRPAGRIGSPHAAPPQPWVSAMRIPQCGPSAPRREESTTLA